MGYQIVRQPNKKFAVWYSVVDNFVLLNVEREEIKEYFFLQEKARISEFVDAAIKKPGKNNLTFHEALETIKDAHGETDHTLLFYQARGMLQF
jgi:hypothetical protein